MKYGFSLTSVCLVVSLSSLGCSSQFDQEKGFSGRGNNLVEAGNDGADGAVDGGVISDDADAQDGDGLSKNGGASAGGASAGGQGGSGQDGSGQDGNGGGGSGGGGGSAGGNDLDMSDDESGDSDDIGIGLESEGGAASTACKFFDKSKKGSAEVTQRISGGPAVDIDITKYTLSNAGEIEGNDYLFTFKVFKKGSNIKTEFEDEGSGWIPHTYNAVVKNRKSASCSVVAEFSEKGDRTNLGCFLKSTRITMADGSKRVITHVKKGEFVLNPLSGKGQEVIEVVQGSEATLPLYELSYDGSSKVVVTMTHPFMTLHGLKQAKELTKVDQLLGADGKFHNLTHLQVRDVDANAVVVNLRLKGRGVLEHMVLADGVVSGDLQLQEDLERQRAASHLPVASSVRYFEAY